MNQVDILAEIRKTLKIEQEALGELIQKIDHQAVRAVELLYECKGRVIVTGMGKTGLIGRKIASTLASTGTPAFYLHPAEAIHGDLGIVTPSDLVLAISNSGETEEVIRLIPHFKQFGIKVIALTGKVESTLARYSDVVVDVAVEREADLLGVAPTASTTALLALGDALASALVLRRGFTKEQFAIFHPGGTLGRKLLWCVKDLMHSGEEVPMVSETANIRDAIYEMTRKRLGATFVVNSDQVLVGIFTDGDLRRVFQKKTDAIEGPVSEYMTKNPKRTTAQALAAEALRLMEERACMILPVVDESEKPVGAIHMHDLVRAGLADYQK